MYIYDTNTNTNTDTNTNTNTNTKENWKDKRLVNLVKNIKVRKFESIY